MSAVVTDGIVDHHGRSIDRHLHGRTSDGCYVLPSIAHHIRRHHLAGDDVIREDGLQFGRVGKQLLLGDPRVCQRVGKRRIGRERRR